MTKSRHLVVHDYGMGGVWWWVWALSERQVLHTIAEVTVVTDPEAVSRAESWDLDEVDIDRLPAGSVLAGLRDRRKAQHGRPGYGAPAGRERVYLRVPDEEEDAAYYMEVGSDGRWIRQVVAGEDGRMFRAEAEDWPINPPLDLFDPGYAAMEIDAAEFEDAWLRAMPEDRR